MLKDLRKKNNLTQSAVAKILNIDTSTIAKWESGVNKPKTEYLPILKTLYGCSLEYLVDCINKKKR